jgi:hypothetical protein
MVKHPRIAFSTAACITLFICFSSCGDKLELVSNPNYAIGTIIFRAGGGGGNGREPVVRFQYSVSGQVHTVQYVDGTHGWNVPSSCSNCGNGRMFMVQYDSLDPGFARMLFSYAVNDSADYVKYKTLFKTDPPGY